MLQIKLFDRETCLAISEYLDKHTYYDIDYSGDTWDGAYGLAPVKLNEDCDALVFDQWLNVYDYGFNACAKTGFFRIERNWLVPLCFVREMRQSRSDDT